MKSVEPFFRSLLVAFCGLWLLYKPIAGPLLISLLLLSLVGWYKKENQFKLSKSVLPWLLLFAFYCAALFWTKTPDYAALERKLAFLAFPLLVCFRWKNSLPIAQMWLSHTLACIILIFIAYYDAAMCQMQLGNSVRCFSTTYFSQVHHPTYFSAFLIFSIIGLLLKKIAWFDTKPRWISWLLIGVFAAMHLHLGTLAGIICIAVVFMSYTTWLFSKKFGWLKSILLGFATLAIGISISLQHQEIKADAQNANKFTASYLQNPAKFVRGRKEPLQGNEVRLILWTASYQIGAAHPLGLGLGGLEPALDRQLRKWGYPQQAKKEFNPHNQYLQIWNELGLFGLFLFAGIVLIPMVQHLKKRKGEAFLLNLIFGVFCLFESMLQRESGVVFFLCWLTIFATAHTKQKT